MKQESLQATKLSVTFHLFCHILNFSTKGEITGNAKPWLFAALPYVLSLFVPSSRFVRINNNLLSIVLLCLFACLLSVCRNSALGGAKPQGTGLEGKKMAGRGFR